MMRREPCAICDNTNATTRICPACRADAANDGWGECTAHERGTDDPEIVAARSHAERLADWIDRRLTDATPKQRAIMHVAMIGYGEVYRYTDKRGHSRGKRQRWKRASIRKIAEIANATKSYVARVVKRFSE